MTVLRHKCTWFFNPLPSSTLFGSGRKPVLIWFPIVQVQFRGKELHPDSHKTSDGDYRRLHNPEQPVVGEETLRAPTQGLVMMAHLSLVLPFVPRKRRALSLC